MSEARQKLLVGFLAFLLSVSVVVHSLPVMVSQFMVDDSFYYLQIAKNLAQGHGFTFDGLHQTNGFQPLFQLMLVPIFWLPLDLQGTLYAEKVLEAAVFAVTAILLFTLGRRLTGRALGGWIMVMVLFLPGPLFHPIATGLFTGMESGVDALLLLIVLHLWLNAEKGEDSGTFFLAYGLSIGALFLARLDNIIMIGGIALWHAVRRLRGNGPRLSLLWRSAGIGLAIVMPYLLWNRFRFGDFIPISGLVKSWESSLTSRALLAAGWGVWFKNTLWFVFSGKTIGLLPLGGLLAVPILFLVQKLVGPTSSLDLRKWSSFLTLLWATSVIKVFWYAIFQEYPGNNFFWYYVQELIVIAICVGLAGTLLAAKIPSSFPIWLSRAAFAMIFCASWLGILLSTPVFEWELASLTAVHEIAERVEPDAVIGAQDAGLLGYFLPNHVVHLGGLVNDREFYEVLKAGRLQEYVYRNRITYLANLADPGPDDAFVMMMGRDNLVLLYQSGQPVPSYLNWIYKLYAVRLPHTGLFSGDNRVYSRTQ